MPEYKLPSPQEIQPYLQAGQTRRLVMRSLARGVPPDTISNLVPTAQAIVMWAYDHPSDPRSEKIRDDYENRSGFGNKLAGFIGNYGPYIAAGITLYGIGVAGVEAAGAGGAG